MIEVPCDRCGAANAPYIKPHPIKYERLCETCSREPTPEQQP